MVITISRAMLVMSASLICACSSSSSPDGGSSDAAARADGASDGSTPDAEPLEDAATTADATTTNDAAATYDAAVALLPGFASGTRLRARAYAAPGEAPLLFRYFHDTTLISPAPVRRSSPTAWLWRAACAANRSFATTRFIAAIFSASRIISTPIRPAG